MTFVSTVSRIVVEEAVNSQKYLRDDHYYK